MSKTITSAADETGSAPTPASVEFRTYVAPSMQRAGSGQLSAEDRSTMFMEWCALRGFGKSGWPEGAYEQLVGHIRQGENPFPLKENLRPSTWSATPGDSLKPS